MSKIIPCWVSPTGEIVPVEKNRPHFLVACDILKSSKHVGTNADGKLIRDGWLKITNRNPQRKFIAYGIKIPGSDGVTAEQKKVLDDFGIDDISFEDTITFKE